MSTLREICTGLSPLLPAGLTSQAGLTMVAGLGSFASNIQPKIRHSHFSAAREGTEKTRYPARSWKSIGKSMPKTAKLSCQESSSEVSGWAKEVFRAKGVCPGEDIEVGI